MENRHGNIFLAWPFFRPKKLNFEKRHNLSFKDLTKIKPMSRFAVALLPPDCGERDHLPRQEGRPQVRGREPQELQGQPRDR